MSSLNEQLPKEVKDEARKLAEQLAPAWMWWSSKVTFSDLANIMRGWLCTGFATEAKQDEYLARCAKLGIPHLMDGWHVEKHCLTVKAVEQELDEAVGQWEADAAETGEKGSDIYYEVEEVKAAERWLKINPFVFWLLGHVIEEAASDWALENAVGIEEESNKYSSGYVCVDRDIRIAIDVAVVRFFDVYKCLPHPA